MIRFNYKQIDDFSRKLYKLIKKDNYKVDYVIGISRGGLIPSTILSNCFDCKLISISANSYKYTKRKRLNIYCYPEINLKNKNVLLVDEISDTGKTLKYLKNKIINKYSVKNIKTASCIINIKNIKEYPDYYIKK